MSLPKIGRVPIYVALTAFSILLFLTSSFESLDDKKILVDSAHEQLSYNYFFKKKTSLQSPLEKR